MHRMTLSIPVPQTRASAKPNAATILKSDPKTVSLKHHTRLPEGK